MEGNKKYCVIDGELIFVDFISFASYHLINIFKFRSIMAIRCGYLYISNNPDRYKKLSPSLAVSILENNVELALWRRETILCYEAGFMARIFGGRGLTLRLRISNVVELLKNNGVKLFIYCSSPQVGFARAAKSFFSGVGFSDYKVIYSDTANLSAFKKSKNFQAVHNIVCANSLDSLGSKLVSCIMFSDVATGERSSKYECWPDFGRLNNLYKKIQNKNLDVILYSKEKSLCQSATI